MIELIEFLMPSILKNIARYEAPFVFSIELPDKLVPLSDLIPRS
jgi:hypothetical protein